MGAESGVQNRSLEGIADAADIIGQLRQRWDNRLTVNNLALAKRYAEGKLHVLICWKWLVEGHTKQFRALFQRGFIGDENALASWDGNVFPSEVMFYAGVKNGPNIHSSAVAQYRHDGLVFVQDVELMQSPERAVPTFIWFQVVDEADRFGRSALYIFGKRGFKFLFGLPNDKMNMLDTLTPRIVMANNGAHEEVESRSEIVDYISDNSTPLLRRALDALDFPHALSGARIILNNNGVRLLGMERLDLFGQLPDVGFGPFDL
ncbi:MAG: hypothetical protein ACT4OG_08970 [Alphaproteobacteria bacterium]